MLRSLRRVCVTVAIALALTAPSPAARADVIESAIGDAIGSIYKEVLFAFVVVPVVVGSDIAFTIHDPISAGKSAPARKGWSIAETIIATPQMLFFNGGQVAMQGKRRWESTGEEDASRLSALLPATWTSAMAVHGIWGLASPSSDPGLLYGGSWAVGANVAFTVGAVSAVFEDRRLPGKAFGIVEMAGTAPSIAVSAAQLADPTARWKPAWTALTVWSSALFLHGVASTVKGFQESRQEDEREKKKAVSAARRMRLYLAPTLSGEGLGEARGLVVGGVF